MHCLSGQMERAAERPGGVGKKFLRYDAGRVSSTAEDNT